MNGAERAFPELSVPFPKLNASGDRALDESFRRLAELTTGATRRAKVSFTVGQGDSANSFSWDLGSDDPAMTAERAENPDLEVLVDEDTWWALAEGATTPLEAFGRGHVRIRGDVAVARSLAASLNARS